MRRRIPSLGILLAASAAMLALACAETSPTATVAGARAAGDKGALPGANSQGAWASGTAPATASGPRLLTCPAHPADSVTATIGASGGTIVVGNDQLIIPAGALNRNTVITATIPADTLASIHFEPHGLQFKKPAGLVLGTSGCATNGQAPDNVVYLDDSGNILETIPAQYSNFWHTVAAPIQHFSVYAIAF